MFVDLFADSYISMSNHLWILYLDHAVHKEREEIVRLRLPTINKTTKGKGITLLYICKVGDSTRRVTTLSKRFLPMPVPNYCVSLLSSHPIVLPGALCLQSEYLTTLSEPVSAVGQPSDRAGGWGAGGGLGAGGLGGWGEQFVCRTDTRTGEGGGAKTYMESGPTVCTG